MLFRSKSLRLIIVGDRIDLRPVADIGGETRGQALTLDFRLQHDIVALEIHFARRQRRGVRHFRRDGDRVETAATRSRVQELEPVARSEEHTSELQSLMRISYAVFCLK